MQGKINLPWNKSTMGKKSSSYNGHEVDTCGSCMVLLPSVLIDTQEDTFDYLVGKLCWPCIGCWGWDPSRQQGCEHPESWGFSFLPIFFSYALDSQREKGCGLSNPQCFSYPLSHCDSWFWLPVQLDWEIDKRLINHTCGWVWDGIPKGN